MGSYRVGMAGIRVSAEEVAALGTTLQEISAFVSAAGGGLDADGWALGPGASAGELAAVLGSWQRHRLLLGRHLDELAAAAKAAGAAYVSTEQRVGEVLAGGTTE